MHDHEIDLSCVYTLKDCLFGAVKLSKTINTSRGKISYYGYKIRKKICFMSSFHLFISEKYINLNQKL